MERFKSAKKVSTLGIIGNIFLLAIKGTIGLITKSQAMIADSLNSAGDIFSSLMTYIGNKIASKPQDEDHNLGHGKAEYIYSMLISIIMIFMSLLIIKEGTESLIKIKKYTYSNWLVVICIITIIVKFGLYLYTREIGKKYNNLLVIANSKDHINDCILTTCTLISSILAKNKIFILDGIVGIIIGIWILITGLKIFKESYDILMDKAINEETKKEVYEIIKKHKEIKKINHFNSTPIGYLYQISFTIFVDGDLTTFESHEIADKLEKEITKKIDEIYLTVIHVNPIKIDESSNKQQTK
jgi:cation diffusion facilitator family transporter